MHVLVTCKFDEDRINTEGVRVEPIISQWELCVAMATTVLTESAPNPESSVSPIPLMIHIKFYQDWPTDL